MAAWAFNSLIAMCGLSIGIFIDFFSAFHEKADSCQEVGVVFQNDFPGFVQNPVERPTISEIHPNGELAPLKILFEVLRIVLLFCMAGLLFFVP